MILILGGTSEGREIMEFLYANGISFIGTVTSQYGKRLVQGLGDSILRCQLDEKTLRELLREKKVHQIIDCTHPFAVEISLLAMGIAEESGVEYIRFERPSIKKDVHDGRVQWVKSYEEAGQLLASFNGAILSTIGSRRLHILTDYIKPEQIVARVLPDIKSIQECMEAGIKRKNIIGMQGPFSLEFNESIYNEYYIQAVIMKESGEVGGTSEKIQSALAADVMPVVISRPELAYPKVIQHFDQLHTILNRGNNQ